MLSSGLQIDSSRFQNAFHVPQVDTSRVESSQHQTGRNSTQASVVPSDIDLDEI